MQTNHPFFDDLAKLASNAAGAMNSARSEMEETFRAWLQRQLDGMDLVTRDEFETVKAMVEKARAENDALRAEIDSLKAARTTSAKPAEAKPKRATASARKPAASRKTKPATKDS
ncbi:accessory factor UbiK family protein [Eilatimonas milleporae]|uniref:BMFP domain-containing protein YqiC n=1 Tax=Eilatimonas milleporae TaxID=911205 RepID=A0A3M0CTM2_9PROT|nr:accessory factor UbiK family protein [Eilatimonas milleporae]RMB12315.1 hypothetical protein BXY39_0811 [Eilatimonas milleporae]